MSSAALTQQAKANSAPTNAQHDSHIEANKQLGRINEAHSEFADLRAHPTAQRQQQYAADHSTQSYQLKSFQQMARNSARATQLVAISTMNAPAAQRVEEEEAPQNKSVDETLQRAVVADEVADSPKTPNPNNTGLPKDLKSGIESLSGMSMDHVKVHYNSSQPAQLNAHAYAQGSEIHVAPGQEQHLPHEAWHVVQQAQGRVKPTLQMKTGVPVNDDKGLEHEADVMGAKALQTKSTSSVGADPNSAGHAQKSENPSSQGKGVAQLLGKVGSIAVGAIIGTIVPVLGTIIGGYIGYRHWKRKQRQNAQAGSSVPVSTRIQAPPEEIVAPMEEKSSEELEGQRRMLEEEAAEFERQRIAYQKRKYGSEIAKPNSRELGALIDRARGAYLAKEYQVAFELLTNRDVAAKIGIDLRTTEEAVTVDTDTSYREVANALATGENMMFFPEANRINLRIPLPTQVDQRLQLAEVPELAKLMLPMFLEEYVHALQHWTKRHFSKHTDAFARETGAGEDREQDMDEVDVMALFHEWGFDIEGIDYVGRYKERQDYWKWLNAKKD